MINQKPISLKIQTDLLEQLDAECQTGWQKRNRHINIAVQMYLDYLDTRRRIKCYANEERQDDELGQFLRRWFLK